MDSGDQSQETVTSTFTIDLFSDVTEPTVEQEEQTTKAETTRVVNIAHSSESPKRKEITPLKEEDEDFAEPNVSAWIRREAAEISAQLQKKD